MTNEDRALLNTLTTDEKKACEAAGVDPIAFAKHRRARKETQAVAASLTHEEKNLAESLKLTPAALVEYRLRKGKAS